MLRDGKWSLGTENYLFASAKDNSLSPNPLVPLPQGSDM